MEVFSEHHHRKWSTLFFELEEFFGANQSGTEREDGNGG
jgi:hypothetical protein